MNQPILFIQNLANISYEKLTSVGVEVQILNKKEIEEIGMTAFLNVARGAYNEPKFIVMKYTGNKDSDKLLAFVGKGLTYDSGGYCIKSPKGMSEMHCDMGGFSNSYWRTIFN